MRVFRALVGMFRLVRERSKAPPSKGWERLQPILLGTLEALPGIATALAFLPQGDLRLATLALLGIYSLITALSVAAMDAERLFVREDALILMPLPVHPGTLLLARLSAILRRLMRSMLVQVGPGALILGIGIGTIPAPLTIIAGAALITLVLLPAITAIHFVLLRVVGRRRLARSMVYVAITVQVLATVGLMALLGMDGRIDRLAQILSAPRARFAPHAWGTSLSEALLGRGAVGDGTLILAGAAVVLGGVAVLATLLGGGYLRAMAALAQPEETRRERAGRRRTLRQRLGSYLVRHNTDARAGFLLGWPMVRRSPQLRGGLYIYMASPLVMLIAIGLLSSGRSLGIGFSTFVVTQMGIIAPQCVAALLTSDHPQAGWIREALPIGDPVHTLRGACLAAALAIALPVIVAYSGIAAFLSGLAHATQVFLYVSGLFMLGLVRGMRGQRHFPFSHEASQLARAPGFRADWFVIVALFVLLFVVLAVGPSTLGIGASLLLFLSGTRAFLVTLRARPQTPE